VLKDDPTLVSAYDLLAQVMEQKGGDTAQTEMYLSQAIEKNPTSAVAYIQRANYRIRAGKSQEAAEDLTQAGKCDLDKTDVKILLAEAWLKANQPEQTRAILEDVLSKEADNASAWLLRARMVLATGKPEDMAAVAEEGLKALGEDSTDFLPVAAELFIKGQKTDRAKGCVDKLRQAQVNEVVLVYIEGVIAEKDKDWGLAARSFRKAYELGRKDEDTAIRTANALVQNGDILAASAIISAFLNTQSESFRGQLLAGDLMARQRQWTLAMTHLRKALLLNPKSAEAGALILQTRLQRLSSASVSDDSWDMLIKDLNQILQQQDSLSVRAMLFRAAMQSGKKELAAQQAAHQAAFTE
jgi:tetratricopeptide (TPR) repeat protein